MSYQKSDSEISDEYHELANKCILLKNRKKFLEEWMKNVGNIQKIEEGKTQIEEIDKELKSLEPQLENALTAYMKTKEYGRINKYLQEIKDHADTEHASLNKVPNIPIGGSKSRRRHRRHRKHVRKTRRKRAHRSRAARKHKKYTRRR